MREGNIHIGGKKWRIQQRSLHVWEMIQWLVGVRVTMQRVVRHLAQRDPTRVRVGLHAVPRRFICIALKLPNIVLVAISHWSQRGQNPVRTPPTF